MARREHEFAQVEQMRRSTKAGKQNAPTPIDHPGRSIRDFRRMAKRDRSKQERALEQ